MNGDAVNDLWVLEVEPKTRGFKWTEASRLT